MSWRDQLRRGSFRGVPFYWQRSDAAVGRKTARHDYPLRDDCYIEDLGLAPPEFTLEVLVIGPDYMTARDNLIKALQQPGPGTLIHPTMGTLQVAVSDRVRVHESTTEGGLARFTIPFVVAGKNRYPTARFNTAKTVYFSASAVYGQVLSSFAGLWRMVRMPAHIIQSTVSSILGAADTFLKIARLLPGIVPDLSFKTEISALKLTAESLLSTPDKLAARITSPVLALSNLSDSPGDRYRYHRELFTFGSDFTPIPLTTSSRVRQAANQAAFIGLVRQTAISEAASAATLMEFESYQEAVSIRDELCGRIDMELESEATTDEVFSSLVDLRASVVADINERGANLARIASWTPVQTMPVLIAAHRLYGDASRADELIARNSVRHPAFLPGGTPIEVLIYG